MRCKSAKVLISRLLEKWTSPVRSAFVRAVTSGMRDELDLVEIGAVRFVVVGIALHLGRHAGRPALHDEGSAADRRRQIHRTVGLRRHDRQVIVGQHVRQIWAAVAEREHDRGLVIGLHIGHERQDRLGRRLGVRSHVMLHRRNDIVGGQALAVVEGQAGLQLESPFPRFVGALEALGQIAGNRAVWEDLRQIVA